MKKKTNVILFLLVSGFVFLYAGSSTFEEAGLGLLNKLKNVFLILIILLQTIRNHKNPTRLPQNIKAFFLIMIPLYLLELCAGKPTEYVTPILGFIELYIATKYSDKYFIKYLYISILTITLISCVLLINIYVIFGFYAREEMLFDKSMITFLFGVSYILLILDLKYSSSHHKWITVVILFIAVISNLFILQSKTSLLVLIIAISILSIQSLQKLPQLISKYSKYLLLSIVALLVLPIEIELPDQIKQAINLIAGKEVFQLTRDIGTETYDIRENVMNLTIEVTSENPIMGIGFGNTERLLKSNGFDLTQAESQILDMLLDGGITYLIAFTLFLLPMTIYTGRKILKHKTNFTNDFIFLQSIGFIILCISNEMFTSLGWFFMGTLAYLYITHEKVNILGIYWNRPNKLIKHSKRLKISQC